MVASIFYLFGGKMANSTSSINFFDYFLMQRPYRFICTQQRNNEISAKSCPLEVQSFIPTGAQLALSEECKQVRAEAYQHFDQCAMAEDSLLLNTKLKIAAVAASLIALGAIYICFRPVQKQSALKIEFVNIEKGFPTDKTDKKERPAAKNIK